MSETSSNKTIAKNTVMLYIRMLISMLVGLYTPRVVLRTLGVEDYGFYGVVGGVVSMMGFLNASNVGKQITRIGLKKSHRVLESENLPHGGAGAPK